MQTSFIAERQEIAALLQETSRLLDNENFEQWLSLFASDSHYEITAYSNEINRQMSWWKADRRSLEQTLGEIRRHVRDLSSRLHLVVPVEIDVAAGRATAISNFAIYRTSTQGETQLYAVGRYEDVLVCTDQKWLYAEHRAVVQTRIFGAPTHVPL